jgi:hypothetical protein
MEGESMWKRGRDWAGRLAQLAVVPAIIIPVAGLAVACFGDDSENSVVETYITLLAPSGLAIDNSTYIATWNSIASASGYVIEVNGVEHSLEEGTTQINLSGKLNFGENSIRIMALGNGDNIKNSPFSQEVSIWIYDVEGDNNAIAAAVDLINTHVFTSIPAASLGNWHSEHIASIRSQIEDIPGFGDLGVDFLAWWVESNASVSGTYDAVDGVNGFYVVTISVSKGAGDGANSNEISFVIEAIPYNFAEHVRNILQSTSFSDIAQANQTNTTSLIQAKAKAEAIIDGLHLYGVTATIVDGMFTAAVTGTAENFNGTRGEYRFTIELLCANGNQATVESAIFISATPYDSTAQDNADVAAKKALIEGTTFPAADSEYISGVWAATDKVKQILGIGDGYEGDIDFVINGVFTAVVHGCKNNPDGTDGSFVFTIQLSKGKATPVTTTSLTMTIKAMPYDSYMDDHADISAVAVQIYGATFTVDYSSVNTIEEARAFVETVIAGLDLNGVTFEVIDHNFVAGVMGNTNAHFGMVPGAFHSENGRYSFRVKLSKGNAIRDDGWPQPTLTITVPPYDPTDDVNAFKDAVVNALQNATLNAGTDHIANTSQAITKVLSLINSMNLNALNPNPFNGATIGSLSVSSNDTQLVTARVLIDGSFTFTLEVWNEEVPLVLTIPALEKFAAPTDAIVGVGLVDAYGVVRGADMLLWQYDIFQNNNFNVLGFDVSSDNGQTWEFFAITDLYFRNVAVFDDCDPARIIGVPVYSVHVDNLFGTYFVRVVKCVGVGEWSLVALGEASVDFSMHASRIDNLGHYRFIATLNINIDLVGWDLIRIEVGSKLQSYNTVSYATHESDWTWTDIGRIHWHTFEFGRMGTGYNVFVADVSIRVFYVGHDGVEKVIESPIRRVNNYFWVF